jgi:FkbM family methyltransferase
VALGSKVKRNRGRFKSIYDRERKSDHKEWALKMLNNTLSELPIKKLKEICEEYNLPQYGSKTDISKRIQKNLLYETYSFLKNEKEIFLKDYRFDFIFEKIKMENDFYEHELLDKIDKYVEKGSIGIDVGGHIGNHTTYFLKISELSKVYTFEPRKPLADLLLENARLNKIEQKLILNKDGISALSSEAGSFTFEKRKNYNLGTGKISKTKGDISVSTLDRLFSDIEEKVGVIKIDVEGLEREVLIGGKSLIEKHRPIIVIESLVKSENQKKHDEAKKIILDLIGPGNYKLRFSYGALPGPYTYLFAPIIVK